MSTLLKAVAIVAGAAGVIVGVAATETTRAIVRTVKKQLAKRKETHQ